MKTQKQIESKLKRLEKIRDTHKDTLEVFTKVHLIGQIRTLKWVLAEQAKKGGEKK